MAQLLFDEQYGTIGYGPGFTEAILVFAASPLEYEKVGQAH